MSSGFRVPCISSLISTPPQVSSILERLLVLWEGQGLLPPVDVALGNLTLSGELSFGSVLPFVTGPIPRLARLSNTRNSHATCLERSREVLTLLRRLLMSADDEMPISGDWIDLLYSMAASEQRQIAIDIVEGFVNRGVIKPY